jgi:hypothetical protein
MNVGLSEMIKSLQPGLSAATAKWRAFSTR